MKGERDPLRARSLATALAVLVCLALLAACAGQGVEIKPRGQTVISVGTGSR